MAAAFLVGATPKYNEPPHAVPDPGCVPPSGVLQSGGGMGQVFMARQAKLQRIMQKSYNFFGFAAFTHCQHQVA